ncbi:putative subfamily C member protein [Clavispora lusitaniae]|uniref:Subfamily C member protein n=1 Tax=Clavispora lusitaniae TaxID=36911 RepID=A0ACD0WDS2_CLALS|nr:DnaJ domain family protein [Clavispora lusitaniae]QFZ25207.1 putative subfamily C member protein [Clavispora lusitaniae]QFZ31490.1 putative subfamily C member protein [Clavispora lusitaniae]QFZ37158.1 putative subfamily C member protein [Clavispora lusitaniae]QFZ42842.1 putative subfamily C member protein [Clavispora lusitaniae]
MSVEDQLRRKETEIKREDELRRILACHSSDYFAVLQINPLQGEDSLPSLVRKSYRQKSLLLHPDKIQHEDAPRAFDLLKKAEIVLSDPENKERGYLIDLYRHVASDSQEADYDSPANASIRAKVHAALELHEKQQEVEKNYQQRQETQKHSEMESMAKERERKKEWEKAWESQRESRVQSWREFSKVSKKKKKPKKKVLV